MNDAPKVSRYDAITRGALMAAQNWSQVSVKVLKIRADNGISTMMLK